MKKLEKFIPLVKVEEQSDGTLKVFGLVTAEAPDRDGEICHFKSTVPYYKAMAAEFAKATSIEGVDPSIAPLRYMHGLDAVGKGTKMDFDETNKAIMMGFDVIDKDAANKVRKGVLTGFSQGGNYVKTWTEDWKDPKDPKATAKSYRWYTAQVGEISLVDSPCLESARFEYVKADGSKELRKFEQPLEVNGKGQMSLLGTSDVLRIAEATAALVKAQDDAENEDGEETDEAKKKKKAKESGETNEEHAGDQEIKPVNADQHQGDADKQPSQEGGTQKTKKIGGKELKASEFIIVGDESDPRTWRYAIKSKVTADQIKAAYYFLADQSIPENIREAITKAVNEKGFKSESYAVDVIRACKAHGVETLAKSLWDVHTVADALNMLFYTQRCLHEEAIFEGDESPVPGDLADLLETLVEIFVALVGEETSELLAAISGQKGATKTMSTELEKARKSVGDHIKAAHAMVGDHHDKMVGMHKSFHDVHKGHLDAIKTALGAEKAAGVSGSIDKAHASLSAHTEKAYKAHGAHKAAMHSHLNKMAKAIGAEEEEAEGSGPTDETITEPGGGAHPHKASGGDLTMEGIAGLFTKMLDERDKKNDEEFAETLKAAGITPEKQPDAQTGVGNRKAVVVAKNAPYQTQINSKGKDQDGAQPGAEKTEEIKPSDISKALGQGDTDALLKLARTIKPNANGVPTSLSGFVEGAQQ